MILEKKIKKLFFYLQNYGLQTKKSLLRLKYKRYFKSDSTTRKSVKSYPGVVNVICIALKMRPPEAKECASKTLKNNKSQKKPSFEKPISPKR